MAGKLEKQARGFRIVLLRMYIPALLKNRR